MGRYDSYVCISDHERVGRASSGLATSNATALCLAEGFDVALSGAPSVEWEIGQIVTIVGSGKTAYCRVAKRTTSPSQSVRLVPLQTTKDSAGVIGFTFPNPSVVSASAVPQDALTLVVDLSDAPDGTYKYAIVASGGVIATSVNEFTLALLVNSLVDDPLGGAGSTELAAAKWKNVTTSTVEPFNFVETVTLQAGQRYEFRLLSSPVSVDYVELSKPRIQAIRYDTATEGSQVAEVTTTSGTAVDIISLAALPAGDYLLLASWLQQCSLTGTGNATRARLRLNTTGTNVGACVLSPIAASDYISCGFAGVVVAAASEVIKLQHLIEAGSPTSRVKQAKVIAIPLPPGIEAMGRVSSASGTNASLIADAWNDMVDSGTIAFEPGTHLEFIQFGHTMAQEYRPKWGPEVYENERRGLVFAEATGSQGSRSYCNFFAHRYKRTGPGKMTLQTKPAVGVTSQSWADVRFSWLREKPILDPAHESPYSFAVEIEPSAVYKKWSSVGTDLWRRPFPDAAIIARVMVNGVDYAKVPTSPTVARTFFWDLSTRQLTIKMDTGEDPAGTGSAFKTVLVCEARMMGRDFETFIDEDGVTRPYVPELEQLPSIETTLAIRAEGSEIAGKFGDLKFAAGEDFKDAISGKITDGMRIRVWRGSRDIHTELAELQPIINAQMASPSYADGIFSTDIIDRALVLKAPIAKTTVSVYSGTTQKSGQLMPVIYGTVRGVPAYRTTNNGSGTNTFRVCDHACKNLGAIQSDGTFQAKAYADATERTPGVASITVTLTGPATFTVPEADTDHWQLDVLYVDVQGITDDGTPSGRLLEMPGEINRHILVTYAGYQANQLVEASFLLMDKRWRVKKNSANVVVPQGVTIGLYLTTENVRDASNIIAKAVFSYWTETRLGRIRLGVPDAVAANLIGENAGFERDTTSIYPWRYGVKASSVMSTSIVFEGVRSLQLSNANNGDLRRSVLIPRPGLYALTTIVSLHNGEGSACRVGFISPHDGMLRQLSSAVQIASEQWLRVSTVVKVEEGGAGTGTLLIIPYSPEGYEPEEPAYGGSILFDLDASRSELTFSGERVTEIENRVSGDPGATQAVPAEAPLLAPSAIAGHPALHFDGPNTSMNAVANPSSIPCTFMVVYAYRTRDSRQCKALAGVSEPNWFVGPYQNLNQASVGSSRPVPSAGAPTVDAFEAVVVTLRQITSSSSELYVNGVLVGTQTGASQVVVGSTDLYLGVGGPMYLARGLAWTSAISSARRTAWERALMRKYGISSASINIDNAEVIPVAAHLEPVGGEEGHGLNVRVGPTSIRPDHYFAVRVPRNPRLQDAPDQVLGVIRGENEARGVISSYDPEASEAHGSLPAAGRYDHVGVMISAATDTDADNAARGVADALVLWHSRQRNAMEVDALGLWTLPEIGDRIFHGDILNIPKTVDDYPIWLIAGITDKSDPASEIGLELERHIDPVADRPEIAPTEIPLGAVGFCVDSSCPADYDEVTEGRTFYAAGSSVPNLSTVFGFDHHVHDASHDHPLLAHGHTAAITGNLLGATKKPTHPSEFPAVNKQTRTREPLFNVLPVARGASSGDHGHVTSGTITYSNASGTSSTATLETYRGPNDVKNRRGLWCRRVRKDNAAIPASMIFGFVNSSAPTNWNIADGSGGRPDMRGFAPRGADPGNTGVSARAITSAHTQSATANGGLGGYIVCALTSINLHDRVTVTDGSKTYHGRVSSLDPANGRFTCQPSHETNDSVDGSSYAAAGATTITIASSDVNTTFTPDDHLHVRSGANGTGAIEAHLHDAEHEHVGVSAAPTVGLPNATEDASIQEELSDAAAERVTTDAHVHNLTKIALPIETGDTAVQSSSPYGGTLTGASQNKPPVLRMPFIMQGGAETSAPAGLVIFWEQSNCPLGYDGLDQANGRLIMGALAGEGLVADDGGHFHSATYVAHVFLHRHVSGGAYTDSSDAVSVADSLFQNAFVALTASDYAASGSELDGAETIWGHAHDVAISSVQNIDPTLTQVVENTGVPAGALTMPVHKRWKLCARS